MEFKTPKVQSAAAAWYMTDNVSSAPTYGVCWSHCLSRPWARI